MIGAAAAHSKLYFCRSGIFFCDNVFTSLEFLILFVIFTVPSLTLCAISDRALIMFFETDFKNFFASAFFKFVNPINRFAQRFKFVDMFPVSRLTNIY